MQDVKKANRLLGRLAVMIIAALPIIIAFTYPGSAWFEEIRSWFRHNPHVAPRHPWQAGPGHVPITVTPPRPLGTDSSVSPVPLRLLLVHTEPGRNNSEGLAQIGVNARTPQTYRAGAILANGARLSEIHPAYVILKRGTQSVRLDLHGSGMATPQPESELLRVGGSPAPIAARPRNPDPFTDYLRPSPIFRDGSLHGYVLYAGRHQDAFFKMGLQPGDVVTQINGVAVKDPQQALASLHSLTEGATLSVQVERAGTSQIMALDGALLSQAMASSPPADAERAWSSTAGKPDFDATSVPNVISH